MICNDTANYAGGGPVATVMNRLADGAGTPDLACLASAVVSALPNLPHALHLAVAIDSDRAPLLDRNWQNRQDNCLVAGPDGAPRWLSLPGGWRPLAGAVKSSAGEWVQGTGPVPGGAPWAVVPDPKPGAWCLLPLLVADNVVAIVVLEAQPGLSGPQWNETCDRLAEMGRAVGLVTGLWAATAALTADLVQSRGEKRSLTRLNRLQGRFVAMASHEFKTPLTSITAYTDVLRSQLTDDEFPHASEFLDVIKTEADRLLRMVNRILDFTRMEYGSQLLNRQATDLEPLVHETVRGLQPTIQDKKLTVIINADEALPRAEVDADLIRQVLVNLCGNAVKFTPREGTITISLTECESAVSVSVADDGPGVPAGDLQRVFREFYRADGSTAHEEGTGLGLTIVRHIVNLHGGHIDVREANGGGADFRFLVPKETGAVDDLPVELCARTNPAEVRTLIDELLRLIAELTGSRAVALLLRDGKGALVPAGAMGWEAESCTVRPIIENQEWTRFLHTGRATTDPGRIARELNWCPEAGRADRNMFAPLGSSESSLGVVITGRRRENGVYTATDLAQLMILADVAKAALLSMSMSAGRAAEAVRLLLKIRRTGVPTSTPLALDLLAKLARQLGVGETGTRRLLYAAALHDAGMARVEDEIVLGDAKLNVDERDEVDRHVEQGVDLLAPLLPDEATADIIRYHHEKFDGTGYPAGLKAAEIPLGSRLLAVIDAWFSLTGARTFRPRLDPEAAMAEISSHAGTQFDPAVVTEFQALLVREEILDQAGLGSEPKVN